MRSGPALATVLAFPSRPSARLRAAIAGTVADMTATLVAYQATASESDAVRCLMGRGFPIGAIVQHGGDALVEAQALVVAGAVRETP